MSTLLDQINANTEAIKTGKNTVVDAITAKGGVVNPSGSVPTFKEIANGVSSINTSGGGSGGTEIITKYVYTAGNGATDITAKAISDISMKDTVAVLKNTGEYLVQGANNRLSNSQNLYGYGIAKSDIANGSTGTVSLGFLV